MMEVDVQIDGDNCWPDLQQRGFSHGELTGVARLRAGMESGKSSVTVRIETPDGKIVLGQTSMDLFLSAARAFQAREEAEGLR